MSKLRINDIHDDMSPRELRRLLEPFGKVGEISIHAGGNLVYGLVDMDHDDAVAMIDAIEDAQWEARKKRGKEMGFTAEMANYSRRLWLSHPSYPLKHQKESLTKRRRF